MSICQKAGSLIQYVPPRVLEAAIVLGTTALSGYLAGIPSALTTFATYFAGRKYVIAPMEVASSVEKETGNAVNPPSSLQQMNQRVQDSLFWKLDRSVLLSAPSGNPPILEHQNNSCFLASAIQVILTNAALLEELPGTIARRLEWYDLFECSIELMCTQNSLPPEQLEVLISLAEIIAPRGSLDADKIRKISELLQKLDKTPLVGAKKDKFNELLSLLELYNLIVQAQSDKTIGGGTMSSLRQTVRRVNSDPQFREGYFGFGDPYEVLRTFVDLILKDSRHEQRQITKRAVIPIPYQQPGAKNPEGYLVSNQLPIEADENGNVVSSVESNTWGWFELNQVQEGSLENALENHLTSFEGFKAKYHAKGAMTEDKKEFIVTRTWNEMDLAPEYLVIKNAAKNLQVTPKIKASFGKGKKALYALSGVITHNGVHCTALVNGQDGFYHIDDIMRTAGEKYTDKAVLETATKLGYVFTFKKVRDL